MIQELTFIGISLLAYLWGGVPTGKIVVKIIKKKDIQKLGSKSIGATNVKRILGIKWAVLVALLDILKGFLPVFLANQILEDVNNVTIVGIVTILGNIFSPYLKLKGGKGIATGAGVLLYFAWWQVLIGLFIVLLITKIFDKKSVASFSGLIVLNALLLTTETQIKTLFILIIDVIIIFSHRQNLFRLIKGKELSTTKK